MVSKTPFLHFLSTVIDHCIHPERCSTYWQIVSSDCEKIFLLHCCKMKQCKRFTVPSGRLEGYKTFAFINRRFVGSCRTIVG